MASVAGGQLGQTNTLSNGIISCLNAGAYGPSTSAVTNNCIFPNTQHSVVKNSNLNNITSNNYFNTSTHLPLASTSSNLNQNDHSSVINNGIQSYLHNVFTPNRTRSISGTPPTPEPSPLDFLNDILQVKIYVLFH